MSSKTSTKKQNTKKNNEDIEKTQNKKNTTKTSTKNNISEEDTQTNNIIEENNIKSDNKVSKPKIPPETSERYIGIFYGGILKTTEFIMVKDECCKYGPNIYYKKIKSLYENRLNNNNKLEDNTKLKKITGVIFSVLDSDYLYEKFINVCDNPQEGCAENERIYYQDINDMDDEILNNIHLIHSKNLSYIKDILNDICATENMKKSIKIYPEILRESKPKSKPKVIKTANPQKSSSRKTNIDEDLPVVKANVIKNNQKINRKPVAIEDNTEEETNEDELKNNKINESDDEVDEINDEDNENDENDENDEDNEEVEEDDE